MHTQPKETPSPDSPCSLPPISPEELYDYVVTCDGSGWHVDRIGAWAAIVTSWKDRRCQRIVSVGGATHTETGRAELMAILAGLHSIFDVLQLEESKQVLMDMEMDRPTVHIISDRENLVNIIKGENEAHKNIDLWWQFQFYTRYMDISAEHIPGHRHARDEHDRCDAQASLFRIVLQDYLQNQKEVGHI